MDRVVEIILYQLKPGTGHKFHQIMEEVSIPLHQSARVEVVAFGNSLHNEDAYFLIRAFDSLVQMTASQNSFYNSDEWLNGPRSDIVNSIQSSSKSVLSLDKNAVNTLKSSWNLGTKCPPRP